MKENKGKIFIYKNENGDTKIDVFFQDNNIRLAQKALMDYIKFQKTLSVSVLKISEYNKIVKL